MAKNADVKLEWLVPSRSSWWSLDGRWRRSTGHGTGGRSRGGACGRAPIEEDWRWRSHRRSGSRPRWNRGSPRECGFRRRRRRKKWRNGHERETLRKKKVREEKRAAAAAALKVKRRWRMAVGLLWVMAMDGFMGLDGKSIVCTHSVYLSLSYFIYFIFINYCLVNYYYFNAKLWKNHSNFQLFILNKKILKKHS